MKTRELFPTITYRTNSSGSLQAAYLGAVRIGYIDKKQSDWIWQLILLRPEGGNYFGRSENEDEAKSCILTSAVHWLDAANLQPKETTHATPSDLPAPARIPRTSKSAAPRKTAKTDHAN